MYFRDLWDFHVIYYKYIRICCENIGAVALTTGFMVRSGWIMPKVVELRPDSLTVLLMH